jgi:hypothetical protein
MSSWLPLDDPLPRPRACSIEQVRAALAEYLERVNGCALCGLLRRLELNHVIQFATAQLEEAESLRNFYAGRVLCNWHFWEVNRSFESPWFADRLSDILALLPADLGLADLDWATSLEGLPLRRARCWICHELARDQADYVDVLVHLLEDATFRGAYERSRGLCLPHVHVVAVAAKPVVRAWVLGAELEHWRRLKHDLAELARKGDPELRAQLTPSENTAPFRCVQKLVGAPGRPWPSEPQPPAQPGGEETGGSGAKPAVLSG